MFCTSCQSALYSGEFGQKTCRKCEVDALKADLAQSQKQYFEMVELAGKESHRAADLEDEIERLRKERDNFFMRMFFYMFRAAAWKTSARTWRRSSTKWQGMYEELKRRLSTEGKSDDCLKQKLGLQGPQPKDRNCQ